MLCPAPPAPPTWPGTLTPGWVSGSLYFAHLLSPCLFLWGAAMASAVLLPCSVLLLAVLFCLPPLFLASSGCTYSPLLQAFGLFSISPTSAVFLSYPHLIQPLKDSLHNREGAAELCQSYKTASHLGRHDFLRGAAQGSWGPFSTV